MTKRIFNKKQIVFPILISFALIFLSACATPVKKIQVSNKLAGYEKTPPLNVAILPLEGKQEASEFFREALHASLTDSGLNISERYLVDGIINQNGWNTHAQLLALPPQKLGEALGADALLYGKVTRWDKYYAVFHSTLVVGVKLRLVDARTGELLWTGEQVDRDFEGILKIPTGIISAFLSPILFIGNQNNLDKLADKVAREITESLRKPYLIKEEEKMKEKIVVASAKRYIEQLENNAAGESLSPESELTENDFLIEEDLPENMTESAEVTDQAYNLPEIEKQPEQREQNEIEMLSEISPGPSPEAPVEQASKISREEEVNKVKLASAKTPERKATIFDIPKLDLLPKPQKTIYTIQVGAFQSKNYANTLIAKLKKKGYNSFIAMARIGKKMWYKVQIDRFDDKKEALLYANKIKKKEKLSYFITKTEAPSPSA